MTLPALAIAAIWLGVGIAAWGAPREAPHVAVCAMFATGAIAVCVTTQKD